MVLQSVKMTSSSILEMQKSEWPETLIEETANERFGSLRDLIIEMVNTEKANFQMDIQKAQEAVRRAESAADIATTKYTTAMKSIWELDEWIKALEAKTQ